MCLLTRYVCHVRFMLTPGLLISTLGCTPQLVSGVVLDVDGSPKGDIFVSRHPFPQDIVLSDDRGAFAIPKNDECFFPEELLVARDSASNTATAVWVGEQDSNVIMELREGVHIRGSVVDSKFQAIPRVTVVLFIVAPNWRSSFAPPVGTRTQTDEQGGFEFLTVPEGLNYSVEVSHDEYAAEAVDFPAENKPLVDYVPLLPITMIPATQQIRGTVVDEDGQPIPQIIVHASAQAGSGVGQPDRWSTTDGNGRFEIQGVCAGPIRIRAVWIPSDYSVELGECDTIAPNDDVTITARRRP